MNIRTRLAATTLAATTLAATTLAATTLAAITLAAITLAGCGSDEAPSGGTYDTCTTHIAGDVPAFYKTYSRCVNISMSGTSVVITSTGLPPHNSYK